MYPPVESVLQILTGTPLISGDLLLLKSFHTFSAFAFDRGMIFSCRWNEPKLKTNAEIHSGRIIRKRLTPMVFMAVISVDLFNKPSDNSAAVKADSGIIWFIYSGILNQIKDKKENSCLSFRLIVLRFSSKVTKITTERRQVKTSRNIVKYFLNI